jgi:RNA polymerase sigma factor (sigma-70 family)
LDAVASGRRSPRPAPRRVLRRRSDAALGDRFAAGDEVAFAVLYERHRPAVLAICLAVLGSRQDAEDAAQEAFATLAVTLRTSPPRELRPWLVRVARNAAIDLARRRPARAIVNGPAPETGAAKAVEGNGVANGVSHELDSVLAGIRQLPEAQRTALLMRELAGHSYDEIATMLHTDQDAVRGLIARARIGLRNYREATDLPCTSVRMALAAEPDGRRHDKTVRRHLRACGSCQAYRKALKSDAKALRALVPAPVAPVAGAGAVLGLATKGAVTGGALTQVGAVCAVSICSVGGFVLVYPHPVPRHGLTAARSPDRRSAAGRRHAAARADAVGPSAVSTGTASASAVEGSPSPARGRATPTWSAAGGSRTRAGASLSFTSGAAAGGRRHRAATAWGQGRVRAGGDAGRTGDHGGSNRGRTGGRAASGSVWPSHGGGGDGAGSGASGGSGGSDGRVGSRGAGGATVSDGSGAQSHDGVGAGAGAGGSVATAGSSDGGHGGDTGSGAGGNSGGPGTGQTSRGAQDTTGSSPGGPGPSGAGGGETGAAGGQSASDQASTPSGPGSASSLTGSEAGQATTFHADGEIDSAAVNGSGAPRSDGPGGGWPSGSSDSAAARGSSPA